MSATLSHGLAFIGGVVCGAWLTLQLLNWGLVHDRRRVLQAIHGRSQAKTP